MPGHANNNARTACGQLAVATDAAARLKTRVQLKVTNRERKWVSGHGRLLDFDVKRGTTDLLCELPTYKKTRPAAVKTSDGTHRK